MGSSILKIRNLKAGYGKKWVLKNINMEVHKNKVTAIMGPSGCGKSTLIRCINRIHEMVPGALLEGDIYLNDISIFRINPIPYRGQA